MKPLIQLTLATAAGIFIGAGATTLMAQTAEPKAYIIANIADIHDPNDYKNYAGHGGPIQAEYGGRVVARGTPVALDGQSGPWATATPPHGNVLVIEFPSQEKLLGFWHSPGYSALRPIRERSSTGVVYTLPGVPPT